MEGDALGSPLVFAVVVGHVLAAVLTVGLAVYVARNYWDKTIGKTYTLLVASTSVAILGSLARVFVTDLDAFVALSAVKYVGIATAPVFLLAFALLYDGRNHLVSWRRVVLLLVVPAVTVVGVATTRVHGLFYQGYGATSLGSIDVISITDVGPWYWLFACYSWGILVVGTGAILYAGVTRSRFYRRQTAVVVPAIAVSWGANLAYAIFGWPHVAVDPTPIAFAIANALFAVGIFSTRLIDITPGDRSALLNVIEEAVVVLDEEDRIVGHNDQIRPLLRDPRPIAEPADRVLPEEVVETTATDPTTIELTVDSRQRFYRCQRVPFGPEGTYGSAIVLSEVTAEKASQQRIEQANQRLRQVIDLIPDPLFAKNLDDEVLLSNEANAELHGMSPEEIEGKQERAIEPDVENIEDFDKYRQREVKVVETGEQMTFEEELTGPDGDTYVFKTTRIPFETAGKEEDAVLSYARDVTDRKEYERELERSNEKLDQFAGVVSHDLRNPLAVAKGYTEALEPYIDEEGHQLVEEINRSHERMQAMIDELLVLSRTGETIDDPEQVVLADVVSESWATVRTDGVDIELEVPDAVTIEADETLFKHVFENLVRNAVDHNDPPLTIRVGMLEDLDATDRTTAAGFFIADDGDGIPKDDRNDIFEHGYTTDDEGTGFGLSIVADIVDAHGWDIDVTEGEDGGARFEITDAETPD
jgi:PAS domain S-box-containing protein